MVSTSSRLEEIRKSRSGERDSLGCLRRSQGADPGETKGGSDSDNSTLAIIQSTTVRAGPNST